MALIRGRPRPLPRGRADPRPLYIDVVTYGAQAGAVANHVAKGRPVALTGRLEYREWRGADNVPHSIYEVVANPGRLP